MNSIDTTPPSQTDTISFEFELHPRVGAKLLDVLASVP